MRGWIHRQHLRALPRQQRIAAAYEAAFALDDVGPTTVVDAEQSFDEVARALRELVEPLVSAVYAADLEKLSVLATLSRFRDMEREHGSLIRGLIKLQKAAQTSVAESLAYV